jgi:hypothetical protein
MRPTIKSLSLALLAIPAFAAANPVTITFDHAGIGNDYMLTYGHERVDAFVGSLIFSEGKPSKTLTTYCVDLAHFISNGQSYSVNPTLTTTLSANNVYRLAGDVLDANVAGATTANNAAALQLAIWKTVYGNQFSVSGVSSAVLTQESKDLAAGAKYSGSAIYLQGVTGCKGQSQITTTPEPCSMAVLGIGAFGVFFRRRRA